MTTSHQISSDLFLNSVALPKGEAAAVPVPQKTNHIVVLDCSGSMYYDLPKIRAQLKDKIPKLMAEEDTLSIIWFSGRGEFGTLLKGEPLATLKDLSDVNRAIDRWLRPVFLTGFKEPIEEAAKLADELGGICNLFFMSDGYDNQWDRSAILKAAKALSDKCAASTWVEYGNYCNHPLMVAMAETAGGSLILNENFGRYEPNFEAALQNRPTGAKKLEISIDGDALRGFAFALHGDSLLTFKVEDGKVLVPEYLDEVWYMSPDKAGPLKKETSHSALYAAIALYGQRVESDIVLPLLKITGDVRLINQFGGCFGKQKYAEFTETASLAAFDNNLRLVDGYDPSAIPDDNAFTVLDLLNVLSSDDGNYLLIDSPDFKYNLTGRPSEQVVPIPEDVQEKIDALDEKKDAKKIATLMVPYQPLKFKKDPKPKGVPISSLTFNETRPNVSILVKREGTIDLKARKNGKHKKVPDSITSHIHRNYMIIRDGIINVDKLPLRLTKQTAQKLLDSGLPEEAILGVEGEDQKKALTRLKKAGKGREVNIVINLRAIPVVNRSMVKKTSAEELFKTQYELTLARSAQKVFNSTLKDLGNSRTSVGYSVLYGEESADWLKEQGITDYNGFGPKTTKAAAQDVYIGKELKVSLKGLSSVPSLNAFNKKVAEGKSLTASMALLKPSVDAIKAFLDSEPYKKAKDQETLFKTWLNTEAAAAKGEARKLLHAVSQTRFSVIVGQTWFTEFESLDDNTMDITVEGGEVLKGTIEMKEIEVPV